MNIDSNRSHVNGRWDPRLLSAVVAAMLWLVAPVPVPAAPAPDDPYVAGYAGAVLEREFKVSRRAVTVDNGVLTLDAAQLAGADRGRILSTLAALPGVTRVEVREAAPGPPPPAPGPGPWGAPPGCPPASCRRGTSSSRCSPIRAGRTSRPRTATTSAIPTSSTWGR
jgi:hypothetical protein